MEIILTVISTVISMAIGALITWWVSKYYYEKAGKELESEASELKNLNTLILRAMENAGLAKFNRDKNGDIKGMVINLSAKIEGKSETSVVDVDI